jgi:hypothetical protein
MPHNRPSRQPKQATVSGGKRPFARAPPEPRLTHFVPNAPVSLAKIAVYRFDSLHAVIQIGQTRHLDLICRAIHATERLFDTLGHDSSSRSWII